MLGTIDSMRKNPESRCTTADSRSLRSWNLFWHPKLGYASKDVVCGMMMRTLGATGLQEVNGPDTTGATKLPMLGAW